MFYSCRSLKLENYEIDEDIEVSQPLSVPYVIFDKTKPTVK